MNKQKAPIIAIANKKGGVGKTTTTKALALGLEQRGKKVLAIGYDSQGDLERGFGVSDPDSLNGIAMLMRHKMREQSQDVNHFLLPYSDNLTLLVGNIDLMEIDRNLSGYIDGMFFLQDILEPIRQEFDCILIDCMPHVGCVTQSALVASDFLIIPTQPKHYSVEGIRSFLQSVSTIKRFNPDLHTLGLLPTMVDFRLNSHHKWYDMMLKRYQPDMRVFEAIPLSTKLDQSSEGKNMFEYDPSGKAVKALNLFVDQVWKEVQSHGI